MRPVQNEASITVIENKVLTCGSCLHSSYGGRQIDNRKIIACHLMPKPEEQLEQHFCGQGLWLIDGTVYEFKEAWTKINTVHRQEIVREMEREDRLKDASNKRD